MSYMFSHCSKLSELDLSSFNTNNVTNMRDMFSHCEKLSELDLSSFNTINVNDMEGMFSFCKNLSKLDLSSFNTNNVNKMRFMFFLDNLNLIQINKRNIKEFKEIINISKLEI